MFESLDKAVELGDAEALQQAIFDLGMAFDGQLPDEVTFKIIDLLRQDGMFESPLAAHLLNHFEFHSRQLSDVAKDRCIGFLRAWGDRFKYQAGHVVAELREGHYLDISTEVSRKGRRR